MISNIIFSMDHFSILIEENLNFSMDSTLACLIPLTDYMPKIKEKIQSIFYLFRAQFDNNT
jgi:hypothetical protein